MFEPESTEMRVIDLFEQLDPHKQSKTLEILALMAGGTSFEQWLKQEQQKGWDEIRRIAQGQIKY